MTQYTEDIDIKQCLNLDFGILSLAGVWTPARFRNKRNGTAFRMYSSFALIFYFYLYIASEVVNIVRVFGLGDMERTVEASFLLLTHLGQAVKTFNNLRWAGRIRNLIDSLNEPVFNRVDVMSHGSVLASMRRARANTRVFLAITVPTILMWAAFPLFEADRRLPLQGWFPFDSLHSPCYEIAYAYQIASTCVNAVCNLAHDTIAAGVMALMCGQLDVLCDKLSGRQRRTVRPGATTDGGEKSLADNTRHLSGCVEHHMAIIRFLQEAEKLFNPGALAQFAVGCVIVCITAFKLSILPISVEFFSTALYMACMLTEILLYCYYGNEIMIKSVRISEAAYESLWYEHSLSERRMLFIIMERCKRPLCITAGRIFTLSLDTFTSILRSSYSYFAVLQQVHED